MAVQGDFGAHDPDRRRRFRRSKLPDVRPIVVRQALRRLKQSDPAGDRDRDRLEASVRRGLRQT